LSFFHARSLAYNGKKSSSPSKISLLYHYIWRCTGESIAIFV
jgi:hypothetical protein